MILFNYEGTWNDSTGDLWTFQSMTLTERVAYVIWYIPNFPLGLIINKGILNLIAACFVNPLLIGWTIQKILNRHRETIITSGIRVNIGLTSMVLMYWFYFIFKGL
ncbi:MAG: hypothetical protein EBR30_14480 [Cytophagia bacterium]|nr:hypothetical protein [Cytophagia bacterium]NBW36196.1 hypothetical protein [Cytophagia bacterium]